MTVWWLILIVGSLGSATLAFIWMALTLGKMHNTKRKLDINYEKSAMQEVERIFNDEFREELRNRGRLHFEKIISDNDMFLRQDLQLTTSQLNDYMKQEIGKKIQEVFANYEQSMSDAQQQAVDYIKQTTVAAEEQRKQLAEQLEQAVQAHKEQAVKNFEDNMAEIINHYLVESIGNKVDLQDQLGYILSEMEANKQAMREDMLS